MNQVKADSCEFLEAAKEYKGRSEPMFLLYRVSMLRVLSMSYCSIVILDPQTIHQGLRLIIHTPSEWTNEG